MRINAVCRCRILIAAFASVWAWCPPATHKEADFVDQVAKRDVPVVQVVRLIFAAVYINLNLVADVPAIIANPRLRHPK